MLTLEQLRKFAPLQNLSKQGLEIVAQHAEELELPEGSCLFEIGDCAPNMFFLLQGRLHLIGREGSVRVLDASGETAQYAVGNLLPRRVRAVAASPMVTIARLDRDLIERELAWDALAERPDLMLFRELSDLPEENRRWILALLHTPTFLRLPLANVPRLLQRFKEVTYAYDDVVIREGAPGDAFYLIRTGSCRVVREVEGREIVLGRLHPPDSFGDEALIANSPRSATVIMDTAGVLMRLDKNDFIALLQAPLQKRIGLEQALTWVRTQQARLLDVRGDAEYAQGHLAEARNIPLYLLYLKSRNLPHERKYIVYCDTGHRSDAAAFLLVQRGFDAYVLENAAQALRH